MGKDLKDLEKELKKDVKRAGEEFEKATKVVKKASKNDENSGWLIWALIIFLFVAGLSPIALILLLVKLFGGDQKKKPAARASASAAKPKGAKAAARKAMKTPDTKESTAKWLKVGGIAIMVIALLGNWDYLMWFLSGDTYWWSEVVSMLGGLIGGGAMFLAGRAMSGRVKRYAKYLLVMGDRESVSVEEFSRTLGLSRRKVERDLEKMIDLGYFGGKAYLHRELGYLLRGGDPGTVARQQPTARPAAQQQSAEEVESEYAAILRKIRLANDRIEDEVLSAKIDRIEFITASIFRVVEQEPEKKSRIQTLLNYYLPTTQKLLDSYAEFEAAGVEGTNVRQAKQRIELTMDKIIEGFEHQLDELYRAEAMDVDRDIRVMESMLRRDTATVEKDFGTAVQSQREMES